MKLTAMVLVSSLALAAPVLASPEMGRLSTAAGMVASVDNEAHSLVVNVGDPKGAAKEITFFTADESKIIKDGAAIELTELKQGDKVTITYKAQDGKNVIVNIGVESKT
jgi:Cu/Ag efflux protein CusF